MKAHAIVKPIHHSLRLDKVIVNIFYFSFGPRYPPGIGLVVPPGYRGARFGNRWFIDITP